jgi:hypothetical protein
MTGICEIRSGEAASLTAALSLRQPLRDCEPIPGKRTHAERLSFRERLRSSFSEQCSHEQTLFGRPPALRVHQIGNEDLLGRETPAREPLLVMVAEHCINGCAVLGHAIGPPVVSEKVAVADKQVRQPW